MNDPQFIGLDIETTGSDVTKHALIQIGVYRKGWKRFERDVGHETWVEEPEAMKVNGFDAERIRHGETPRRVDGDLANFLRDRSFTEMARAIPVGWNVAAFDMPFVRKLFPESSKLIHYRAVDLNSICFTIAERWKMLMERSGRRATEAPDYDSLKNGAKKFARERVEGQPHDAGYDAEAAILEWEWLQRRIPL